MYDVSIHNVYVWLSSSLAENARIFNEAQQFCYKGLASILKFLIFILNFIKLMIIFCFPNFFFNCSQNLLFNLFDSIFFIFIMSLVLFYSLFWRFLQNLLTECHKLKTIDLFFYSLQIFKDIFKECYL